MTSERKQRLKAIRRQLGVRYGLDPGISDVAWLLNLVDSQKEDLAEMQKRVDMAEGGQDNLQAIATEQKERIRELEQIVAEQREELDDETALPTLYEEADYACPMCGTTIMAGQFQRRVRHEHELSERVKALQDGLREAGTYIHSEWCSGDYHAAPCRDVRALLGAEKS